MDLRIPLFDGPVMVIDNKVLYQKRPVNIMEITEQHVKFDGSLSKQFSWSINARNGGSAVLIFDRSSNDILLVEQLRPATLVSFHDISGRPFLNGSNGRILEIPAGGYGGDEPKACAVREVWEEAGIRISEDDLESPLEYYLSPGITTEAISSFIVMVDSKVAEGVGGGLLEENEDIKIHWIDLFVAYEMIKTGEIRDAKTIIAIQQLVIQNLLEGK